MVMAENSRSGLVWDTFMENPEAQRGMQRAGFVATSHEEASTAKTTRKRTLTTGQ
jgi:hypothetical protein